MLQRAANCVCLYYALGKNLQLRRQGAGRRTVASVLQYNLVVCLVLGAFSVALDVVVCQDLEGDVDAPADSAAAMAVRPYTGGPGCFSWPPN